MGKTASFLIFFILMTLQVGFFLHTTVVAETLEYSDEVITVRITKAHVGPIRAEDFAGQTKVLTPALQVKYTIENRSDSKKIDFQLPNYSSFAFSASDAAFCKDNFGNNYKRIINPTDYFVERASQGRKENISIYPGQEVEDVLLFEAPVASATTLFLDYPLKGAFGLDSCPERQVFEISWPASPLLDVLEKERGPKVSISFNAKTLSGGTIEPIYENEDANAPREGQGAFTVMKDGYAPYYRHIRDRISWYWVLKYGTRADINLETNPNTPIIISFKVYPNGTIGAVKVVEEAGNHLLASYIRETIAETHLNKFPSYVEEEFIDVRLNFYFF